MEIELNDYLRDSQIAAGKLDKDREVVFVASGKHGDIVWFYMNEEQARDLVRHLNREFDLGLRG